MKRQEARSRSAVRPRHADDKARARPAPRRHRTASVLLRKTMRKTRASRALTVASVTIRLLPDDERRLARIMERGKYGSVTDLMRDLIRAGDEPAVGSSE